MADRIVGFTTTLLIAILTDRAFQMGKRGQLPSFEVAFDAPYFNWTRAADPDWLIEPLHEKANPRNYNQSVLDSKKYYAVNTINDIRLQDSLLRKDLSVIMGGDARTTLMVGNRGKTIRMFENSNYNKRLVDTGLTPHSAFGCLVNFMMQPKKEIFLPIYDQFQVMSNPDPSILKISLQIRTGDHVWGSNAGSGEAEGKALLQSLDRFFSCAQQIEDFVLQDNPGKYKSVLWYLATDSKLLRHAAVAHYGAKLVTSVYSTLEHSAKESSVCPPGQDSGACTVSGGGFTTAAAEWWMLGYAEYHVVTLYSGYGRTGAYRTLSTDRIYTIHQHAMQCTKSSYSDLEHLMYDWSGI